MEAPLYYVLIVNRAFSGLCWGGPQGGLPEELENRAFLSCSVAVLASEPSKFRLRALFT